MVNYLYDLKRLDKHREGLASGAFRCASAVSNLFCMCERVLPLIRAGDEHG